MRDSARQRGLGQGIFDSSAWREDSSKINPLLNQPADTIPKTGEYRPRVGSAVESGYKIPLRSGKRSFITREPM